MNALCMGGWCKAREKCAHYHAEGGVLIERLCEPGQRDAYAPLIISTAPRTAWQPMVIKDRTEVAA